MDGTPLGQTEASWRSRSRPSAEGDRAGRTLGSWIYRNHPGFRSNLGSASRRGKMPDGDPCRRSKSRGGGLACREVHWIRFARIGRAFRDRKNPDRTKTRARFFGGFRECGAARLAASCGRALARPHDEPGRNAPRRNTARARESRPDPRHLIPPRTVGKHRRMGRADCRAHRPARGEEHRAKWRGVFHGESARDTRQFGKSFARAKDLRAADRSPRASAAVPCPGKKRARPTRAGNRNGRQGIVLDGQLFARRQHRCGGRNVGRLEAHDPAAIRRDGKGPHFCEAGPRVATSRAARRGGGGTRQFSRQDGSEGAGRSPGGSGGLCPRSRMGQGLWDSAGRERRGRNGVGAWGSLCGRGAAARGNGIAGDSE